MKRFAIIFVCLIIIFLNSGIIAHAEENTTDRFKEQIEQIEQSLPDETRDDMNGLGIEKIFNGDYSWDELWEIIKNKLFSGLASISNLIVSLLVLAIVSIICEILVDGKGSDYIVLLFCGLIILPPVIDVLDDVKNALESGCVFMMALIPVYAGLMISGGMSAAGGGYSAMMFAFAQGIEIISENLLLPVCGCLMALSVSSSLIKEKLKNIVGFLTKSTTVLISVISAAFITVLSLQTAISKASDSIGLRTAKLFSGSFIPITGSLVSESLSVVITGMHMLRSSIGIFAIISLVVIFAPAVVKTVIIKMLMTVFSYLFDSIGASSVSAFVKSIGGIMSIVISIESACVVVFIISCALTLGLT